jgi:hypothetical protein
LAGSLASAIYGYSFYQTDPLTSINTLYWTQAGSVTAYSNGMGAPDPNGGSLISRVAVPDGSSNYEIRANINLVASGGNYTLFARATSDARTGGGGAGTFYAFEMQNPTFTGGSCSATFVVYKRVNGTTSLLGQWPGACANGMLLRLIIRPGLLIVWFNNP